MKTEHINIVYFSATNTTQRIVRHISDQMEGVRKEYNITRSVPETEVVMDRSDVLIVGMPVYAGRIPAVALPPKLHAKQIKKNASPADAVSLFVRLMPGILADCCIK